MYSLTHVLEITLQTEADWAAWLPDTCQVGRLVRLPCGPSRQMLK